MTEDVGVPFSYVPSSAPLPNGVRLVDGNDALLRGKRRKGKSKVLDKVAWFTRKSGESSSKTKHKRESVKRKELQQNDSSSDSSSNGELVHDDSWLYEEEEHVHIENTSNSFEGQQSYVPIVSHVTEGSPSVRARAAVFGPLVRRLSEDANALPSWNRLGALSAGSNYTNHSNLLSSTASLNTVPRVLKNARATAVSTRSQSLFSSLPFLPYAVAKEADPFSDKEVCHCPACCGCRHQSTLELNSKTSGLFQENSLGQRLNSWPRRDCPLRKQLQQLKRDTSPLSGSDESKRTGESDSGISEIDLSPKHQKPDIDATEVKYRMQTMLRWFSEFNDQQRNVFLHKMLDVCDCAQLHLLSVEMEDNLHKTCPHNCQDLLSWLPPAISFRILSLLDPVSLCQASQVSTGWSYMAAEPRLWMGLCKMKEWQLSDMGERKQRREFGVRDGTRRWKEMFAERFRVRRNWLQGRYTVRTFEGHSQGISCVQFDEQRIVSGSSDKTIKVWDIRTNKPWSALTLAGHSATVRCLHLSGDRLVSGSADRTIKVWDLKNTGKDWSSAACRVTMIGHMHTVRCLQVDENKVVSGSYDRTLKVWDLSSGQCHLTLRGHEEAVLCVQFNERKIVSGSADRTIKVWDLNEGYCLNTLHGHHDAVTCLHFDENRIISGSVDSDLKFWDITTGQCVETLDWIRSEGHTGVIRHLQADKWRIVSAADDKTLKVWSVETGQRFLTLRCHTDGVTCLQFNDWMIVSGSYDKTVKLYNFSAC